MENKERFGRIGIEIKNQEPVKFKIDINGLNEPMIAQLMATIDIIKTMLLEKYTKTKIIKEEL